MFQIVVTEHETQLRLAFDLVKNLCQRSIFHIHTNPIRVLLSE